MNKEIFDVLLEFTKLPPASFASKTTPLSETFLLKRSFFGHIETDVPPIALAIMMNVPLTQIPKKEFSDLIKTKDDIVSRYYRNYETFIPQNSLEKWVLYFQRASPEDSGNIWTGVDLELGYLQRMSEFEISMKIWNLLKQSDLQESTIKMLWLYFFFYWNQNHDLRNLPTTPGICQPKLSTEKMVILAMNDIENKSNWKEKVFDEEIIPKWRKECEDQGFTKSMFDWMIEALRFKAKSKEEETGIEMAPPISVYQSDSLIDNKLQMDLNKGFERLLKTDPSLYDWHPGSNEMVLDLIHPSMYCLALRRSHLIVPVSEEKDAFLQAKSFILWYKGLKDDSITSTIFDTKAKTLKGNETVPAQSIWLTRGEKQIIAPESQGGFYSLMNGSDEVTDHRYQWLPTDIRVNLDGKVKFLSYVNSLQDEVLEASLEDLVTKFIPMFERVMTIQNSESLQLNVHGSRYFESFRPEGFRDMRVNQFYDIKSSEEFKEWKENQIKEGKEIPPCPPDPYSQSEEEGEEEEDEWEVIERHWRSIRKFSPPEVKPFVAPVVKDEELVSFKDKTIQIIFKVASVELTPDKPEYEGGVWHVEGTYSEQICATGIYYLDSENITDPLLQFRQKIEEQTLVEWGYDQDDHEAMNRLFGDLHDGTSGAQNSFIDLGHVSTPGKRAIVFPNTMQHKLSPFKLIDPTKSGHRRMIVMFLVEPSRRVTSTAEISQQQCYERETALAFGVKPGKLNEIKLGNLPFDISHLITKEMIGKSKKAFEEFKRIVKDDEEKSKERISWEKINESDERDRRIERGEGTKEDLENQSKERFRETVNFNAPMTFEEASWHRERLMQGRSKLLGDESKSGFDDGWNLCEH